MVEHARSGYNFRGWERHLTATCLGQNGVIGTRRRTQGIPLLLGILVASLCLAIAPAVAEEEVPGDEACLACHGSEGYADESGKPLEVNGERFAASVHAPIGCVACHQDSTSIPHEERPAPVSLDVCRGCHTEIVDAYRGDVHGRARQNGIGKAAICWECHGAIHAVRSSSDPSSPASRARQVATCGQCHGRVQLAKKFGIPVVQPVGAYLGGVHARAAAEGKHAALCSDCHGMHGVQPSSDPNAPTAHRHVPETCGKCHREIFEAYRDSIHGEGLALGNRMAPVCTDCHGEHRILGVSDPKSPVFAANIPGETCGRCHADERLSEKYGLAVGKASAYEDSFHGMALRGGRVTVANCASCHGVHDIRPSSDPRSHVNPANLSATCGKCHPGVGEHFTITSVHGTPESDGAWLVSWVRFIYLWLIGVTIGLMLAHNALDILRKARRPHPAQVLPPIAPLRMALPQRCQHGLTAVSFMLLVYSGFALTYPERWWAAPLLQWEGTFAFRGTLHRVAAVVLLIAVMWHLVELAVSRKRRACMRHMLPAWRDLTVLTGTLAYYFGRRTHPPHGGTFNYAEKAEYWAFMWGMVVMTVTGFLLWFENQTLHYFPNWVSDVSTAIHFYEAILAGLSILVWHMYWVIFDPEVYPMDRAWWHGRMPASRALERMEVEADEPDELDRTRGPRSGDGEP